TVYAEDYEQITENGVTRDFYYLDGNTIIIKQGGTFKEYQAFTDYLGSIIAVVDENGNKVFDASYDVWGRQTVALNTIGLHRGYTGHEMLDEFAIINMNGRIYDPVLGRFFSPDNYVQQTDNSQNYNRYSYCLNNPLKYTDPSGELLWAIPVIVGAYFGGASINNSFNPFKWDYGDIKTYAGMAVGAFSSYVGASVGTAVGGGTGILAGIKGGLVGGMVAGQINGLGMTAISHGNIKDMVFNSGLGGIYGGFSGAVAGGVGAVIPDFKGVPGSSFKNGIYELGNSAIKGMASGLAAGGVMAAMTQNSDYLWKGMLIGACTNIGIAGLNIGLFGSTFIPDYQKYDLPQDIKYRRGTFLFKKGDGITLGTDEIAVRLGDDFKINRRTFYHEFYHTIQIKKYGAFSFYVKTIKQYINAFLKTGNWMNVYRTPGTLEFEANYYAVRRNELY
ncbi:MAG: hypothetical protein K5854_09695, partial [Prevotella sp.]|nr:hypothetical protein [Prevotella sp.]